MLLWPLLRSRPSGKMPEASPNFPAWSGSNRFTQRRSRYGICGFCFQCRNRLAAGSGGIDGSVRGVLPGFGLRTPTGVRNRICALIRELIGGNPELVEKSTHLLNSNDATANGITKLCRLVGDRPREDALRRCLMTVPVGGAVLAMTVPADAGHPAPFRSSKAVGAFFGSAPRRNQSGAPTGRDRNPEPSDATERRSPRPFAV